MMTQNSQFSKANLYSEQPPARKITSKAMFFIAMALISIAVWIHNLFVPSLTGNWLWVSSLFILGLILGLGSMAFSNLKKLWPSRQNSLEQQETASSPGASRRNFSLLIWICSILEMALGAALVVMQFYGNATTKELSGSLIAGLAVSLFLWFAYRAYRYIDW
jgi:F0F1-type ATP synthase assembly protein I